MRVADSRRDREPCGGAASDAGDISRRTIDYADDGFGELFARLDALARGCIARLYSDECSPEQIVFILRRAAQKLEITYRGWNGTAKQRHAILEDLLKGKSRSDAFVSKDDYFSEDEESED